jgi:AcrR family transcriptional regulator
MAVSDGLSVRETKRLQTRERLLGAAIAEFTRAGMGEADVGTIVAAAGVAHGTFFFHFPTKEHVLIEMEQREEERISTQFRRFVAKEHDLAGAFDEAVRLVLGIERRFGPVLFKDLLALHFSPTRPQSEGPGDHTVIVLVAREIELAQERGEVAADVVPINSAVYFLLGLYALLTATANWENRGPLIADYVTRMLHSVRA